MEDLGSKESVGEKPEGEMIVVTDTEKCILCMVCTHECPENARILPLPFQQKMEKMLGALKNVRNKNEIFLFPRATSRADVLAHPFGDCREGRIPRSSAALQKFDAPSACCGLVFSLY